MEVSMAVERRSWPISSDTALMVAEQTTFLTLVAALMAA